MAAARTGPRADEGRPDRRDGEGPRQDRQRRQGRLWARRQERTKACKSPAPIDYRLSSSCILKIFATNLNISSRRSGLSTRRKSQIKRCPSSGEGGEENRVTKVSSSPELSLISASRFQIGPRENAVALFDLTLPRHRSMRDWPAAGQPLRGGFTAPHKCDSSFAAGKLDRSPRRSPKG